MPRKAQRCVLRDAALMQAMSDRKLLGKSAVIFLCVCVCLSLSLSAPLTSSSQMFALLDAAFCSPTTPGAEGRGTDTYLKKGLGEQVFALKHHVEGT